MGIVRLVLTLYIVVLWIRVLFSWIRPGSSEGLRKAERVVVSVTEPLLAPLRRVLPPVSVGSVALDMSVLVLMLICYVLRSVI